MICKSAPRSCDQLKSVTRSLPYNSSLSQFSIKLNSLESSKIFQLLLTCYHPSIYQRNKNQEPLISPLYVARLGEIFGFDVKTQGAECLRSEGLKTRYFTQKTSWKNRCCFCTTLIHQTSPNWPFFMFQTCRFTTINFWWHGSGFCQSVHNLFLPGCVVRNCKAQLKAFAKHYRRTQAHLISRAEVKHPSPWVGTFSGWIAPSYINYTLVKVKLYNCSYSNDSLFMNVHDITFHETYSMRPKPDALPLKPSYGTSLSQDVDIQLIRDCNEMLQRDREKYLEMVSHWSGLRSAELMEETSHLEVGKNKKCWKVVIPKYPHLCIFVHYYYY